MAFFDDINVEKYNVCNSQAQVKNTVRINVVGPS